MKFCFCNARQSAPTDGRDPIGNEGFYTSKQNSDAMGMLYQGGHKDPYMFAVTSLPKGSNGWDYGRYAVKIYTIDGVLIYQESDGSSNEDKQPAGGMILSSTSATSMMETIKNPNTLYGLNGPVISQTGHTKGLCDYYWTSYSRGTDGKDRYETWHNSYLNGYVSQNIKSIYDPCPYGFRVPSNGTYNQIKPNKGWIWADFTGGFAFGNKLVSSWWNNLGRRLRLFEYIGWYKFQNFSTVSGANSSYSFTIDNGNNVSKNNIYVTSFSHSVRCIEERYRYF